MRHLKIFCVLTLWSLSIADKPLFTLRTHPADLQISLDSMLQWLTPYEATRSVGFVGWTAHGMIIAQREGDIPQLFQLNGPGKQPERLSHFIHRVDRFYSNPNPEKPFILLM